MIKFEPTTNEYNQQIKNDLARVKWTEVNVLPLLSKGELFTKLSGDIFKLCGATECRDLLALNLYTFKKNIISE